MPTHSTSSRTTRSGRCALVGRPNVGKSTLLNRLIGQKLAIATPKPQTTRSSLLAVYTAPDRRTQIAFIDTPGLHAPKNVLGRALVEEAKAALADSDVIVFLTDLRQGMTQASRLPAEEEATLRMVVASGKPIVLAINKVDLVRDKRLVLPLIERYQKLHDFAAYVPVSALDGSNVDGLVKEIRKHLSPGLLYDDEDFLTDKPMRFFASEFIREAVIRHTRQELPHSVAVVVESYQELEKLVRISATVVVEKVSQRGIVIGARGSMLKTVGSEARVEIEGLVGRKVFLELLVKVIPGWTRDPTTVRKLTVEGTT